MWSDLGAQEHHLTAHAESRLCPDWGPVLAKSCYLSWSCDYMLPAGSDPSGLVRLV